MRDLSNDETKQYIDENNNIIKKPVDYSDDNFVCIEAPYSFKLFLQEVESMGIAPRIIANCVLEEWKKFNPKSVPLVTPEQHQENKHLDGSYYVSQGTDITLPLRRFHNQIKLNLMQGSSSRNGSIVDFSCGRGGDLYKWYKTKFNKILAIDLSKENIESDDPDINGAIMRLNNMKDDSNVGINLWANNSTIDFIVGDSSKQITDKKFADKKYQGIFNSRMEQYGKHFADCVSMLFSIHYLFDNIKNISNLLNNVSSVLNQNGIFIVTTLDGPTVFNALKQSDNNIINGKVYDYKTSKYIDVWKIRADPGLDLSQSELPNVLMMVLIIISMLRLNLLDKNLKRV